MINKFMLASATGLTSLVLLSMSIFLFLYLIKGFDTFFASYYDMFCYLLRFN